MKTRTKTAPKLLQGPLVTIFAFVWLGIIHIAPAALIVYGLVLGFKAHFLWGIALASTLPLVLCLSWTEVLFGWHWMSPVWPFAYAGLWYLIAFGMQIGLGFFIEGHERAARDSRESPPVPSSDQGDSRIHSGPADPS